MEVRATQEQVEFIGSREDRTAAGKQPPCIYSALQFDQVFAGTTEVSPMAAETQLLGLTSGEKTVNPSGFAAPGPREH